MAELTFLGQGWQFPFQIGKTAGVKTRTTGTQLSSDEQRVRDSLSQIFGTRTGSRFFRRDFGSNITSLSFRPADETEIAALLDFFVVRAVRRHEPRIEILDVQTLVDPADAATVFIVIQFQIIGTNRQGNFVYPFYLTGPAREAVEAKRATLSGS